MLFKEEESKQKIFNKSHKKKKEEDRKIKENQNNEAEMPC